MRSLFGPPPRPRPILAHWEIEQIDAPETYVSHVGRAYTGTDGELILRDPDGVLVKVIAAGYWRSVYRTDR